jgi:hypothetical protein
LSKVRNEIGEVKGNDENHDKEGSLVEDTGRGNTILVINLKIGRMLRPY